MELRKFAADQIAHRYRDPLSTPNLSEKIAHKVLADVEDAARELGHLGIGIVISLLKGHGVTPYVAETLASRLLTI
jgi:hypothetical protein